MFWKKILFSKCRGEGGGSRLLWKFPQISPFLSGAGFPIVAQSFDCIAWRLANCCILNFLTHPQYCFALIQRLTETGGCPLRQHRMFTFLVFLRVDLILLWLCRATETFDCEPTHICGMWYFRMVFGTFLSLGRTVWANSLVLYFSTDRF